MRAKRRIFAGSVCEQEVYTLPDRTKDVKKAEPRPRFSSAEEYEDFKQRLARRNHARMFNATFSPASLYTTITLDNEHEVHTFAEADGIINPFWRRLRRLNPDAQIALYPGRGKTTSRIHFHMVSNGLTEEQIREKWDGGTIIRIEHLREHNYYNGVDHGRDYTGLANYLSTIGHRREGRATITRVRGICASRRRKRRRKRSGSIPRASRRERRRVTDLWKQRRTVTAICASSTFAARTRRKRRRRTTGNGL